MKIVHNLLAYAHTHTYQTHIHTQIFRESLSIVYSFGVYNIDHLFDLSVCPAVCLSSPLHLFICLPVRLLRLQLSSTQLEYEYDH